MLEADFSPFAGSGWERFCRGSDGLTVRSTLKCVRVREHVTQGNPSERERESIVSEFEVVGKVSRFRGRPGASGAGRWPYGGRFSQGRRVVRD